MITWNIEVVIFFILLLDAIGANLFVWLGGDTWIKKHLRLFSKGFPSSKFLAVYYLLLVLWIGCMIYRAGYIQF